MLIPRLAVAFCFLFAAPAVAEIGYIVQTGANQGLLALGIGGDWGPASWATTFGMTASAESDGVITQVNLKSGYTVFGKENELRMVMGPALLINSSSKTFFVLPDRYPDGYYPPNAYFFALQTSFLSPENFFVEVSMLDFYFELLAKNPRGSITNAGILSFGFGKVF